MEIQQKSTNGDNKTVPVTELDDRKLLYIDFTALGGLITEDDGELKPMKLQDFAAKIGVDRTTLYLWKRKIPNFWDLVRARRMEIGSQARVNKVWNGVYLRAAKGDAEQAKIFLSTFDGWQPPMQRQTVELGDSWAALLANKRKKVIEGQVSDATDNATKTE